VAEVHTLCYRRDYLPAIWALKTFYHHAKVDFPLVIHINGPVPGYVVEHLKRHFPTARLVSQEESDRVVPAFLARRGFSRLSLARQNSPFMLKLTDFPLLAGAPRVLAIDSDVLFFQPPIALLAALREAPQAYVFQQDPESTYNLTPDQARRELGVNLAPRINTGIMLYPVDGFDLNLCERYLEHPDVARSSGYIEQTLYALHASEKGGVAYLPETYLVDLRSGLSYEGLVARHFAGPSRPLLTREGMRLALRYGPFVLAQP
jgi:hypothetical protein